MSELERVSVTIEKELLERFDRLVEHSGHQNRSEAVRNLIRNRLLDERIGENSGRLVGTVTLIFDHRQRELAHRMIEAGHHHHDATLSTLHVHLDEATCLEAIVLRGRAHELQQVAAHLVGMKGVKYGKLVLASASP